MIMFGVVACLLFFLQISTCTPKITGSEYAQMPPVFHLDDFDRCMLLEEKALYCTISLNLQGLNPNSPSKSWEIIKAASSNPSNYRHDQLRYGVCVPTTCPNATRRAEDDLVLSEELEQCYNDKFKESGITTNISSIHCLIPETKYKIDEYDILVAIILVTYIVFIIFASFYEGCARYKSKEKYEKITGTPCGKLIAAFSIPKNWYRLTRIEKNSEEKLKSMQGVRFFNMLCVILSHTIMVSLASPIMNTTYVENMTQKILNMFLANGGYAVQSFFLMSGWLLSYHFFLIFERKRTFSLKYIILAFINRYIRLTPTLMVVLAMHSTWLIHLSNGPYWNKIIGTEYTNCRKNWWANLLYINNYIDNENMCMQQTWYLASDTQLFLVSLIVLSLIWKFQRYAKIILGINLIIGMMIPGIVSYVVQSDIVIRQFPEPLYHLLLKIPHWHLLYASGYSNLGGYAIGLCCGYIYYKNLNAKINVKKIHVVLWWILSFGLCIFIILIAGIMYKEDFTYSRLGAAFYWSVGKNLFALGVAIGIYGTTLNIGWFAKWILELPNVQILGRLTYSTYIVHVALAKFRAGTIRSPLFISDYYFFFTAMSDILISYLVGTMLCIAFEMPISALQKIFVPQLSKRKEEDSSEKSLKTVDFSEEEMQTRI